jgi:hypothetical protein
MMFFFIKTSSFDIRRSIFDIPNPKSKIRNPYWHDLSLYQTNNTLLMPTHTKRIGRRPVKKQSTNAEVLHDTWQTMKPFVHFSIKAMRIMAHTLIYIVKHIPRPEDHKPGSKNDKVIKI